MASAERYARRQRSWLHRLVIVVITALVGGTALVLMRGAFRVGEDMLASVEESRLPGPRYRSGEGYVRAAKHVDVAEASWMPAVTFAGRVEYPPGVPADEHVAVELREAGWSGAVLASAVIPTGEPFRLAVDASDRRVVLALRARYLRLDPPLEVSLATSMRELVLQPKLGACLGGKLVLPPNVTLAADDALRSSHVRLEFATEDNQRQGYAEARFDAEMRYEFGGLDPELVYLLIPSHNSIRQPSIMEISLCAGQRRELDLELSRP